MAWSHAPWSAPVYRKSYKKHYGAHCFLDAKRLKYPICSNGKINCRALNAAGFYARLNKSKNIMKRIKTLKRKLCR